MIKTLIISILSIFLLSCSKPAWRIEKPKPCTIIVYITSIHPSQMNKKQYKKLVREYEELYESFDDCFIISIRWMAMK